MAANTDTKVVTGLVRLSYAHIWEPTSVEEGGDKKYSVSIIIPKKDKKTIAKIERAIEAAKNGGKGKWGGKIPKNLKMPLRDGDEDRPEDEAYENSYFINASSKTRPGIVDANCRPIDPENQEEVYSGCYAIASLNMFAFNAAGNKGIAAGLNNIMKIREGEPLGGRVAADVDFKEVDVTEYMGDDIDGIL